MSIAALSFDERYRAIRSRDARFDGQFVTAVRTTGIYCRPSCPARTPRETNVTFFRTSAAAHEAGYRACRRCLPEAAPGSPEWDLRSDAASRAMRLIADGIIDREGVPGLARRLGYSTRHLTRLLTTELGAGPLALARAHRAQTARMLLVGTDLPASDVAFSAGFASIRQFNDTIREVFGLAPLQLRVLRRGTEHSAPGSLELLLPVREPFDADGLFPWLAAHAVPGVESASAEHYARTVGLPGGPAVLHLRRDAERIRLGLRLSRLADLPVAVARVRRLLDLDADPTAIDAALSRAAELAPAVAAVPGIRMPGALDGGETLIRTIVGQQVSLASARTALARLVDALGERIPDAAPDGPDRLFPTPATIAERGPEVLRGPASRIRAVLAAAEELASGRLALGPGDDPAEQRQSLLALPGVGPWTADYVRMRVIGDPDVLLPTDVAVRAGARALGLPSDPRGIEAWATRVAPWRSYLTAHLWVASGALRIPDRRRS